MVRVFLNCIGDYEIYDLSNEEAAAYRDMLDHHPEMKRQIIIQLDTKHLLNKDAQELRRNLCYDEIIDSSRRGEKAELAKHTRYS